MLLVSDVHGAFDSLGEVANRGEPLLVLGDLINFVDYRTLDGIVVDIMGVRFVERIVELRNAGDFQAARHVWKEHAKGREQELRAEYDRRIESSYEEMGEALSGSNSFVTYGNVDRPDVLQRHVPDGCTYVDGEVVEIEGQRVGFAGGGVPSIGVPGEVAHEAMATKLAALGPVDILCTHVAPSVKQLSHDVVGGRPKESPEILAYLLEHQPRWHFFGDIHQPQATTWRVGETTCINVGYFRATRRPVRHG